MTELVGSDSDEEPPELMEEEEIHPALEFGNESIIKLRIKVSSFPILVAPQQWAFVELELAPSHAEWETPLAQLNKLWVVSPVRELRVSRQLIQGEAMHRDLTRRPYERQNFEECVYCCTPSEWGSIGLYVNNISDTEESIFNLLRPTDRVFTLHDWYAWDTRWGPHVEPDSELAQQVLLGEIDYTYVQGQGWPAADDEWGTAWGQIPDPEPL
jgi:hypothetical protein